MKKLQNNLDERQEQALLKIEHNGCWLAFWGLAAALLIEQIVFAGDFKAIIGEWIVFMALAIYLAVDCMRKGIWDRRLKANARTNLLVSLIGGAVVCVFVIIFAWTRYGDFAWFVLVAGLISGVVTFALCFATLQLMARSYRKRTAAMEEEPEELD